MWSLSNALNSLLLRLAAEWKLKLLLGLFLTIFFCLGYFGVQRYHISPARTLPLLSLDRAIPYQPGWAVVYQSIYLLLPVAWLSETRQQLRQYTVGFLLLSTVGFAIIFVLQIQYPRDEVAKEGILSIIQSYDSPGNCLPSLHMALATQASLFCWSICGRSPWLMSVLVFWIILIGYSTMAIKQHYFIDLPTGVALGALGHVIANYGVHRQMMFAERGCVTKG